MAWLIDTNVLSELRRPRPDRRVVSFMNSSPLDELYISTVVLAEIRFGIALETDTSHQSELSHWLDTRIRSVFERRILDITEEILLRWRLLIEAGRKVGRTYSQPDLFLAATALEHGLTLVTRNTRDFSGLGVTLLNPWEDQP